MIYWKGITIKHWKIKEKLQLIKYTEPYPALTSDKRLGWNAANKKWYLVP